MKERKRAVRGEVLKARSTLHPDALEYKSSVIIERLLSLELFKRSSLVMCYMDFKNEVHTGFLIEKCFAMGKRVAVPLVVKTGERGSDITACEIRDVVQDLESGTYGILEPKKDAAREVDPQDIDLVIVPGVAFDTCKNRIGYGAGYYDRFIKKVRTDCGKIGIAFELQVFPQIPADEGDVPVDMVITEERVII